MPDNPYEPPQSPSVPNFREVSPGIPELERRIEELEKRLARSGFLSRGVVWRVLAVWGYLLLGYAAILAVAMPIVWLLEHLTEWTM
jgi:hypothetical protein